MAHIFLSAKQTCNPYVICQSVSQLVHSNVKSDDLNDLNNLNDPNDPNDLNDANDPNDPNDQNDQIDQNDLDDWMTESFADD